MGSMKSHTTNPSTMTAQVFFGMWCIQGLVTHKKHVIGIMTSMDDFDAASVGYYDGVRGISVLRVMRQSKMAHISQKVVSNENVDDLLPDISIPPWQGKFSKSRHAMVCIDIGLTLIVLF